jgi:hypothetical protein
VSFQPPIDPRLAVLPLDDPRWEWKAFERFCLGWINALPDVKHADFYGAQGDKQDGIDILAELTSGAKRTYQCKKYRTFGPARAEKAVDENVYTGASEHVLLVGCGTSVKTQNYVRSQPGWRLLDIEGISVSVRTELDREVARRLVEDHFGVPVRRAFLGEGPLTWVTAGRYFEPFERGGLFRHSWTLVGRGDLIARLTSEIERRRIVIIPGRGGIGKTRLLKELAHRRGDDRVLLALDDVAITPESAEDLPFSAVTVMVDDVHRREDIPTLLTQAIRRTEPVTLVLATRPQRTQELRDAIARAGYRPDELHVAEPLDDLDVSDTESLAREALGEDHSQYAAALAQATSDCPLVTVVGGQLLASRAISPGLLEREQDFRDAVLSRWQDEILGRLGGGVDAALAAGVLRLVAALAPLSVEHGQTLALAGSELGVGEDALLAILGELEAAGLLLARGRLRRIVPDVLADHVLDRACLDRQGRPTGYADELVERYAATSLTKLLRNLAELDWRIGRTAGSSELLREVWQSIRQAFTAADAAGRVALLRMVRPAAVYAPRDVLDLVEIALLRPAQSVDIDGLFGGTVAMPRYVNYSRRSFPVSALILTLHRTRSNSCGSSGATTIERCTTIPSTPSDSLRSSASTPIYRVEATRCSRSSSGSSPKVSAGRMRGRR